MKFQLTHPTRGATRMFFKRIDNLGNFNSHTPHGVRHSTRFCYVSYYVISTHTPHTGCDNFFWAHCFHFHRFQLTHPTRGATMQSHTLRNRQVYFNSHTPHGVRLNPYKPYYFCKKISTHTPHTGCDTNSF